LSPVSSSPYRRFNTYTRFLRGYLRELEAARRTTLDVQTRAMRQLAARRGSATQLLASFGVLYAAAVAALQNDSRERYLKGAQRYDRSNLWNDSCSYLPGPLNDSVPPLAPSTQFTSGWSRYDTKTNNDVT
jgi:hypothetical protein